MGSLLLIAGGIFVVLTVTTYLVERCFRARSNRRAIVVITIIVYFVAFANYFGFIVFVMGGDVN